MKSREDHTQASSSSTSPANESIHPFESSLDQVINALGDEELRLPFKKGASTVEGNIIRKIHGVQHATRVTILTHAILNLYRSMGDQTALEITPRELRLLQLAALFHDSGLLNDRVSDDDEMKNAYKFINICQKWLGASLLTDSLLQEEVAMVATIIANKNNQSLASVFKIETYKNKLFITLSAESLHKTDQKMSLLTKTLAIADGLDVVRCVQFDLNKCPFPFGLNEQLLAGLIKEMQQWLMYQGDLIHQMDLSIKADYEFSSTPYSKSIQDLYALNLPVLQRLFNHHEMLMTTIPLSTLLSTFPSEKSIKWTFLRGISALRMNDNRLITVCKSIYEEVRYLTSPEGNQERSIAAILPYTNFPILIGYQLKNHQLVRDGKVSFIAPISTPTGRAVKMHRDTLSQKAVKKALFEIKWEKIRDIQLTYAELVGDILPEDLEAFYYMKSTNEKTNQFRQLLLQYYKTLSNIDVPIIELDNISNTRMTVEPNFEENAQVVFDAMQESIEMLLKKHNKKAAMLYGNPDSYREVFKEHELSMIDAFDLHDRLINWLKEKREQALSSTIPSREMWYAIKNLPADTDWSSFPIVQYFRMVDFAEKQKIILERCGVFNLFTSELLNMWCYTQPSEEREEYHQSLDDQSKIIGRAILKLQSSALSSLDAEGSKECSRWAEGSSVFFDASPRGSTSGSEFQPIYTRSG